MYWVIEEVAPTPTRFPKGKQDNALSNFEFLIFYIWAILTKFVPCPVRNANPLP